MQFEKKLAAKIIDMSKVSDSSSMIVREDEYLSGFSQQNEEDVKFSAFNSKIKKLE